jgi:hypothetical protein
MNASYQHCECVWRGRVIHVRYCPAWLEANGLLVAHLEIESAARTPLPLTPTGYRSCFTYGGNPLGDYADLAALVLAWLDAAADSADWRAHEAQSRQMALF